MAHKKGAGSSRNGRESHSKRLGIKIFGGQLAIAGNIIVRQRGTKHHPDKNVGIGKDHTLFAITHGTFVFRKKADNKSYVSILPLEPEDISEIVTPIVAKPVLEDAAPFEAAPKAKAPKKAKAKETAAYTEAEDAQAE